MATITSLVASQVTKQFLQGGKPVPVLRGVSQTFERGQSYAIVGVSGSGKSTFMHILGGLETPTSGAVSLFGSDLHKNKALQSVLNKNIGFVFQFKLAAN
mgnify:CR=1 FL=1